MTRTPPRGTPSGRKARGSGVGSTSLTARVLLEKRCRQVAGRAPQPLRGHRPRARLRPLTAGRMALTSATQAARVHAGLAVLTSHVRERPIVPGTVRPQS